MRKKGGGVVTVKVKRKVDLLKSLTRCDRYTEPQLVRTFNMANICSYLLRVNNIK